MIGSEGTLGVITELTLKLIAAPKETISLIVPYPDMESCIATVPEFFKNHLDPQALEFMGKEIVISSEAYVGKQVFPRKLEGVDMAAYLLVTFDGNDADELDAVIEKASEVVLEAGAIDVLVADTPALKRDAWAARSSFLEAIMADTKLLDECDVVVPVTQIAPLPWCIEEPGGQRGPDGEELRPHRAITDMPHLLLQQRPGGSGVPGALREVHEGRVHQGHGAGRPGLRRAWHRPRQGALPGRVLSARSICA